MHSPKSLLFNDISKWIKKGDPNFEVTMSSFDGADICELVGVYILYVLRKKYGKERVGLCRDNTLVNFKLKKVGDMLLRSLNKEFYLNISSKTTSKLSIF